jgi:hypothetical protein
VEDTDQALPAVGARHGDDGGQLAAATGQRSKPRVPCSGQAGQAERSGSFRQASSISGPVADRVVGQLSSRQMTMRIARWNGPASTDERGSELVDPDRSRRRPSRL